MSDSVRRISSILHRPDVDRLEKQVRSALNISANDGTTFIEQERNSFQLPPRHISFRDTLLSDAMDISCGNTPMDTGNFNARHISMMSVSNEYDINHEIEGTPGDAFDNVFVFPSTIECQNCLRDGYCINTIEY